MSKTIDKIQIDAREVERRFQDVLKDNLHIRPHNYSQLRSWVVMQIMLDNYAMLTPKELTSVSQESRLLGAALKLMPQAKQDKTVDLATALAKGNDES